ncbi:helix-turn-helix domain-containing protein [Bacillus thuringiensis]|uniref:AlbA family DNA-binding domain-containing protein n=1 Tax=Bacillus thuringiensis TaxID=1428 RepID=UPI00211D82FB|nr:ATP-binding protein [Bacillus thuringiensis]
MKFKEQVQTLIEQGFECEYLDFKAKMYPRKGCIDLLKDILSMANSTYKGTKYIILGVKDDILNGRSIIGIDKEDKVDSSTYQQYILSNIEPDLNFDLQYVDINKKTIAIIEIKNTNNKPYMIKKNIANLHEGCCLIRKGSINTFAKRADFDVFYQQDDKFEIIFLEHSLRAIDDKRGAAFLEVSLRNLTKMPVTITGGTLLVKSEDIILSRHGLLGLNKYESANLYLDIPPLSEKTGDLYFMFNSSDCIRLGLDEWGLAAKPFTFELILYDTLDNQYSAKIDNGSVYAKGELLWKVKLK